MSDFTDAILAVFTVVLAGATIAYAYWTWRLFKVNEKLMAVQESSTSLQEKALDLQERALKAEEGSTNLQERDLAFDQEKFKAERRPNIFATIQFPGHAQYALHLMNVGKMPAKDIQVTAVGVRPDDTTDELGTWTIPFLISGQKIYFNHVITDEFMRSHKAVDVKIAFMDVESWWMPQTPQRIPTAPILDSLGKIIEEKD